MEQEINFIKFKITNEIHDLTFLKRLKCEAKRTKLIKELEIEPFTNFSLRFQAEYWYIKYMLLLNKVLYLNDEEFESLYTEDSLNIIWLSVTDDESFTLNCIDGIWYLNTTKNSINTNECFKNLTLVPMSKV
ncbi:hypothetical protein AB6735_27025 [Mucilaginibacter sp. RCC_168]|jgi:hypothetical protein|uniref:hypothetical protein n=1 Tax=Mucilaginibacter sp. RCC_168 TaxID=3239221 RepID=UPI0035244B30